MTGPGRMLTAPGDGRPPGPDPARLAGLLAHTWLEVRAGRRSLTQLTPLLAPAAHRRLVLQLRLGRRQPPTPMGRVQRVTASMPTADACEASVLVEAAGRTTALAVRLERHRGMWRVVELTAPEAGLPPLSTASLPAIDEPLTDDPDDRWW